MDKTFQRKIVLKITTSNVKKRGKFGLLTSIAVGIDEMVITDDIGHDIGLAKEVIEEGEDVVEPLGAEHGAHNGVAGEDGGTGWGEDGAPGGVRGLFEVPRSDQRLDLIVKDEVEAH